MVVDSGALSKVAERDRDAIAAWDGLENDGWQPLVPAAVLAEATTGRAHDARVNHLLNAITNIGADDEVIGRLAGALRYAARKQNPSGVDALVAAHAVLRAPAVVITGDTADFKGLLADSAGVVVIGV